jgi:predicted ester cyclase
MEANILEQNGTPSNRTNMNSNQTAPGLVQALTQEEINTLYEFYAVFNKQDYSVVDRVLAPDWQDIPLAPGQKDGADGYKELVQHFTQAFPEISVTVHEIFGTHERAAVRAEISFTHSNALMGIAPTNQKVTIALHEFHHLKDGKVAKTWHLEDWFSMLLQTSAWPVKST